MRIRIALAAALALAACGRSETPDSTAEAPPAPEAPLVQWSEVRPGDVEVPAGVFYALVQNGGAQAAEIAAVPPEASSNLHTGGVSVRLPREVEQAASGKRIRVTVRAAATDPDAVLGVAYSTSEVGNSGWRQFILTTEPQLYRFQYNVGAMQNGRGDFLGFRSYGNGRVQVLGYKVEVIGEHLTGPEDQQPAP